VVKLIKQADFQNVTQSGPVEDLSKLGTSQLAAFEKSGRLADLEASIANLRKAVQFTNDGHPRKPAYLFGLGSSQRYRFESLGELADLEASISTLQKAVHLTDDGHSDRATHLSSLGVTQRGRFDCLGNLTDLMDSITNLQKAVSLAGDEHPNKAVYLSGLGASQMSLFDRIGELANLEDSISNLQRAVHLTKDGHPEKPGYLSNLGSVQGRRFECLGKLADLDGSISNLEMAVQLTDNRHPNKPTYLSNLGISQQTRFDRLGETADLENSISNLRVAVQLTSDGHTKKAMYLSSLGDSQRDRFDRFGELTDIRDSIFNMQKAVQLTDDRHINKGAYFSNLGVSQRICYERSGDLTDLDASISNLQKAVHLTDDHRQNKPLLLANLGDSQRDRYDCLGELNDIEDSISNLKKAVQLTHDGRPNKPVLLSNLGMSQRYLFNHHSQLTDLEDSISNLRKAVQLTDDGNPNKVQILINLGDSQYCHFEHLGHTADLVGSISAFRTAALLPTADPSRALSAARRWAYFSHRSNDLSSALQGYRKALETLPKVAWLGLSTNSRQKTLVEAGAEKLGCLSASCAIQLGRLEEAVELLDLGRSVFWQQASTLRADLERLREKAPELAVQFESVSQKLEASNFSDSLLYIDKRNKGVDAGKDIGKERRRLVAVWEGLLDKIRQLPAFKYFLRPVPFRQLRQAATGGQVVIINTSEFGVDALIFDTTHIKHVPLPDINLNTLSKLARDVLLLPTDGSKMQRRNYLARALKPALRTVWCKVIAVIFNKIQVDSYINVDTPQRRIFWYPTGPLTFIPIHAAGSGARVDVMNLVISSYVTTLGSFFQAQKKSTRGMKGRTGFLAVSLPDTPGQQPIPLSTEEVDKAVQIVSLSTDDVVWLHGSDATVERVSRALDSCSWVHFACHGIQDPTLGMNSAFALYDGHFDLAKIAPKRLSNAQFAFLSVCHAAAGVRDIPGEAMHLAGGLQFAGFPSVIATMWGIRDVDAPVVANHVYEYLFRYGAEACSPSDAATALNRAVLRLREDPNVTVDRWAPFIHFGV
jgi:tetratricopeptide (TPR) repeat protein